MIQECVQSVPVFIPDEVENTAQVDAAREMLSIVVHDQARAMIARVFDGCCEDLHRVAVERVRLAVELDQADVVTQYEVAGSIVADRRGERSSGFGEADDARTTIERGV